MFILISILLSLSSDNQEIKFPLSYVRFSAEGAGLEESCFPYLDSLAEFLKLIDAKIEVGGYTDNVGSPEEKRRISEARAKAVCDYLKSRHNIPESKLLFKGYGPAMPIATNRTAQGRERNNRVEIKILSPIPGAEIEIIKGKILVNKSGLSEPTEMTDSGILTIFDRVLSDSTGRAYLKFNGVNIKIMPNTEILIKNLDEKKKRFELFLKQGKLICDVSNESLSVTTPTCSMSTSNSEFLVESDLYYQDLISVWNGSVMVAANGFAQLTEENRGTICYYGKKPSPLKELPEPPIVDTTRQRFSLNYDNENPLRFYYTKPAQNRIHFLLSSDPEFNDIIYETITDVESCLVTAIDIPEVYLSLTSIDESGLESRRAKTYRFEIINPKRRYAGPRLEITRQLIEKKGKEIAIVLEGRTNPECELLINNVKVKVQKNGKFALRTKLLLETRFVHLSAIDKNGMKTEIYIPLGLKKNFNLGIGLGPSMLAGGGLDASKIGFIFGGNFEYYLQERWGIGVFLNTGTIGCKTTEWEPEGSHFKTNLYIAGLRGRYILNPFSSLSLYFATEIGGAYWKSLYDNTVYEWGINPYAGGALGINKELSKKFSIFIEGGAGYLRNKTKPNMGTKDINYILPKGFIGISFSL